MLNFVDSMAPETKTRLEMFCKFLYKRQRSLNLVSASTVEDLWQRHIIDSLQLVPLIGDKGRMIVDLGSGAGFPGLVLAICGFHHVNLIESNLKKITFLKEAMRITGSQAILWSDRIQQVKIPPPQVITSRACANLDRLFELSWDKMNGETSCFFHKGKNYAIEVDVAKKNWRFDFEVIPSITDGQAAILKINNLVKI